MKKVINVNKIKTLLTACLVLLLVASCKEQQKEVPTEEAASSSRSGAPVPGDSEIAFDQQVLNELFTQYLELRSALVESDSDKVLAIAGAMDALPLGEAPAISEIVKALSQSDGLAEQRAYFFTLSKEMVALMDGHLRSGTVYRQYCPMAFNNTGAFWLSDAEDILNPYFGDAMLKCGKVDKTFRPL
jgi:hypothetical protein